MIKLVVLGNSPAQRECPDLAATPSISLLSAASRWRRLLRAARYSELAFGKVMQMRRLHRAFYNNHEPGVFCLTAIMRVHTNVPPSRAHSKMQHTNSCGMGDSIGAAHGVKLLQQRCDVILRRMRRNTEAARNQLV